MSARSWTRQQRQAIEDRGGALLLSAAAGSGKTAVLTQRAVELLADETHPIDADRLLIVTFTRAAAAELRQRMAAGLEEKLRQRPGDLRLRRQKLLLARASVCTVDSFCSDLLARHFNESELPGDFTLLKTAEETALREQALEETLEEAYADPDFCAFASLFGKARSDRDAAGAILRLYDVSRAMADPEGWWASLTDDYAPGRELADTRWGQELLRAARVRLQSVCGRIGYALQLAEADPALEGVAAVLRSDLELIEDWRQAAENGDWDGCCARAEELKLPTMRFPKTARPEQKEKLQSVRAGYKAALKELREKIFTEDSAAFRAEAAVCRPMVTALTVAVRDFSGRLFAAKQECKAFSFDDIEHAALHLLQTPDGQPTPLARELSDYYALVMVDEYQDTNDLQDRLYQMLARPDGSNLFFVGDVKQSIYGFREARPDCFLQKKAECHAYDGIQYPAAISLAENFRSTAAVIRQINDLFTPLFRREVGGVDYGADEALRPGLERYGLDAPAEVLLTLQNTEGEEEPDDSAAVAAWIAEQLAAGTAVRDGEGLRPCRPGDFCILLRSPGNRAAAYIGKLEARGIGTVSQTGEDLLSDPQVGLLLSLLRVLDNPGQDIHLAAVMLSPLFGFTPDDLTRIRLRQRRGTLYAALLRQTDEKVQTFLQTLRTLRGRSLGCPVQEIVGMLLEETGLFRLSGVLPGGEASQENLRAFQSVSAEYAGSGGLAGFLRLVDAAVKNGRPLSERRVQGAAGDRVRVMSIHASKGLEFPIVILADMNHSFNDTDARSPFLVHSAMGVGFKLQGVGHTLLPTLAVRAIASRIRRDNADEEMRLLYVAVTRARDRLVLSWRETKHFDRVEEGALLLHGCGGVPDETALNSGLQSMSNWARLALLNHPDAAAWRTLVGHEELACRETMGHFVFREYRGIMETEKTMSVLHTAQPDAVLLDALRDNFRVRPPQPPALPVKVSVSALSHKNTRQTLEQPAFLYKEGMSAAQKGTALHRFLQLADLAAARRDAEAELTRMTQQGYLEPEQTAAVDRRALRRFLDSALVQRMLTAQQLLREYEFISRIPAAALAETEDARTAPAPDGTVYLLGIADCVILNGSEAELVDYKTDHGKTEQELLDAYAAQLRAYRTAVELRLGVQVRRSVIYSFALGKEIEVPD